MSSEIAIEATGVSKVYSLYRQPSDRLKQMLWGRWRGNKTPYFQSFDALRDVSFSIAPGEVVGIVGRNGAGKSTLLQMVCGTLQPSAGAIQVHGRVAALLELGAGFNPDFTGIENIYMNGAILGLSRAQLDARLDGILAFAELGDFIHQPVKTYSSGMYMRLAFAVAISVEPDILVIDEALSVGDGAFARKSFDRIMALKDAGKTILFCSHSMYQVEALCSRALWIEAGALRMAGSAAAVTSAYQASLNASAAPAKREEATDRAPASDQPSQRAAIGGTGYIVRVMGCVNGVEGKTLELVSGETDLRITVAFAIDPSLPAPSVAIGFSDENSMTIASVLSQNDGVRLQCDATGHGEAVAYFPKLPLLKGRYTVTAILACENALHVYEQVERSLQLHVTQRGLEQGIVALPHVWEL